MASSEMDKLSKEQEPKTPPSSSAAPPSSQEPSSAVSAGMATPDWSGFQAYSPMPPPHGYVASSPQPHPYMWGVQHMMPPYGTPPHPYVAMYPPGGMYAHPSMPPGSYPYSPYAMPSPNGMTEASGNTTGGTEGDAKQTEVKEKLPIKRSRGSLGSLNMITGKNNEPGKNSGASANGAYSKSGESASDGSSEGSDGNSQNDSGSGQDRKNVETASENGGSANGPRNGSVGTPLLPVSQTVPIMPMTAAGVPGPPTNLNIGMDYWGAPTSSAIPGMHGKVSTPVPGVVAPGSRDGGHSQPWLQDDRELKRQRRKQSNRESARRSRLRKQAECDELAQRAEVLNEENTSLRRDSEKTKKIQRRNMGLQESVKDQNEIVLRLTQHVIATTAGKTSNLVFSPALINVILSFIAARSPRATADKILSLLQASSTDELNAVSSEIVTAVLADSTASGGPMISAANGVWIDKSQSVEPSFKNLLETSYKAAFNQVDFRTKADEVTEEVNSWVEKQTNGLITHLLSPKSLSPLTDLIFANALFFNGRWDKEFDPSLTQDSDFHLLDGTKVRVPFMTRNSFKFGRLYAYEGFKVLDIPYREGRDYEEDGRSFSMQIYLPDEKDGLPALLERLATTRGILNDKEDIPRHRADIGELKIPKFKFAFDFEASEALKGLGLEVPLSTIIHKSCIEVDEVGSKAAAAAAIIWIGSCGPAKKKYDFVADHPFLFLVKEHTSGLHLFLGQVTDPSLH